LIVIIFSVIAFEDRRPPQLTLHIRQTLQSATTPPILNLSHSIHLHPLPEDKVYQIAIAAAAKSSYRQNQPATTASPLCHANNSKFRTPVQQQIPNPQNHQKTSLLPDKILPASQARDLPRFARLSKTKRALAGWIGRAKAGPPPLETPKRCFGAIFEFF
jgi:hypothetical protein